MWSWIRPAVKYAGVETAKIAFCCVMAVMQGKTFVFNFILQICIKNFWGPKALHILCVSFNWHVCFSSLILMG